MERRKAISTNLRGEEKAVGEVKKWTCLGVMGCRDNKRKKREDEGSSYRLCNINLWCRDKRQVNTASEGRISFSWKWMQGTLLKELPFLNQYQTSLDLHLPASPKSLKSRLEAELITPGSDHTRVFSSSLKSNGEEVKYQTALYHLKLFTVYLQANNSIITRLRQHSHYKTGLVSLILIQFQALHN